MHYIPVLLFAFESKLEKVGILLVSCERVTGRAICFKAVLDEPGLFGNIK